MILKKIKFKKVNSTNNTAIRLIKSKNFKSGMVVAETQLKGKGQYGKTSISNKGNLFVSFFHELSLTNLSISKITKINCLLVKKLISKYVKKKELGPQDKKIIDLCFIKRIWGYWLDQDLILKYLEE